MKKTPYLKLQYGAFSYDGGDGQAGRSNLALIRTELDRLCDSQGITKPTGFVENAFTYDGGQGDDARNNLKIIDDTLGKLVQKVAALPAQPPSVLDTGIYATDGGQSEIMDKNLLTIDAVIKEIDDELAGA